MEKQFLFQAIVCHENESIKEIAEVMKDTKRRHLYVVDENDQPVGVISQTDIVNQIVVEDKKASEVTVGEIMIKDIVSIDITTSAEDAYTKMCEVRTFSLPVTEEGKLVGVIDFNTVVAETCQVKGE